MKVVFSIFSAMLLINLANAYDSQTLDIYYDLPTKADRACMNIKYGERENEMDTLIYTGYRNSLEGEYHKIRCDVGGGKKVDLFRAMIANAQNKYNDEILYTRFRIVDDAIGFSSYYSCVILDRSIDGKTLIEVADEEIIKVEDLIAKEKKVVGRRPDVVYLELDLNELKNYRKWFVKLTTEFHQITDFATECYPAP
jgi:hypothetical protein